MVDSALLQLNLVLSATGGLGGTGGTGGGAGYGRYDALPIHGGSTYTTLTSTYAVNGDGGNGGNGGAATSRLSDSALTGSANADSVAVYLTATGGLAGNGGAGAAAVASSSTTVGSTTTVVNGTAAGLDGADGTDGAATVIVRNLFVTLGDGADSLSFTLLAQGPGLNRVTFTGNTLSGGQGNDTLLLGDDAAGRPAAVVNVHLGTLVLGAGSGNTISGFEVFVGGSGNDRFVDGAGNHSYAGGLGADRFEFVAGRAGADVIQDFAAEDVIRLAGFGANLNSFAEVLAAASDTAEGVLIQTRATSSILLAGLTEAQLAADDFLF